MTYDEVVLGRRSIRGYKPDPVPRALIEEIITMTVRAPSSMNTQPWNFYIVTGELLDRIRAGNTERRQDWVLRGFRQFDAPVCVIVTYDRVLDGGDDTPFDYSAVATALVNAAWSRGLSAVINSQGIMQSPVVREHAGIADDQVIMKSIALGWPDDDFPANSVVSTRKTVEEAAVFVGFGDD